MAREKYDPGDTPSPGTVLLPTPDVPMAREYAAGFLVSWEVDIFGSRRNKAASVEALVGGAAEQVHGAQLMVAGDIATNYLEARGIEQRMAVLTKGIAVTRFSGRRAPRHPAACPICPTQLHARPILTR